ncbi:matrixin family metalloprotease [Rosistilla oblonga]|uniref:matrixin family metalloprotease n=1 Tax=Rosistilla oblonga TaxID=2527990 RepID=UPI003A97459E
MFRSTKLVKNLNLEAPTMPRRTKNSTRRQRTRYNRSRLAQIGFERLEERRLLAVMKGDVALAIDSAQTEFNQAFDQVLTQNGLNVDLPIFDKKLSDVFDLSTLTGEAVQTGVDFLMTNQAPDAALTVAQALPLLSARTGGEIAVVNSSVSDALVEFDLVISVNLTNVEIPLPSSINFGAIGIEISLPSAQPFQSSVQLTASTRLRIEDATVNNDTDGISNEARPSSTEITFGANLSSNPVQLDGDVAGVLAYKGQIDFRYTPSIVAGFGSNNSFIPLTSLDGELNQTTVENESTIIVPVVIELDPSGGGASQYLPELGYKTEFIVDVADASIREDASKANVLFDGEVIPADHPDLRVAIIDNYAKGMVSKITEMIPTEVAELLTGQKEVYAGLTINDLIGANAGLGYDSPLDALAAFGVPPAVIETVETILDAKLFVDNPTSQNADKIGIKFPIVDDPIAGVLAILAGEKTDLAIWRVNLVEQVLKSYGFALEDASQLNIEEEYGLVLNVSGERLHVEFNSDAVFNKLKEDVSNSIGGVAADVLDYLVTYLTGGVSASMSFDLQGQVEIGADTYFLTINGGTLSDLADTFYIDTTEPILDLGFQIDVKASLAGAVGLGLFKSPQEYYNDTVSCVGNAKKCAEDAGDSVNDFVDSVTDSVGNIVPGVSFEGLDQKFRDAIVDLRDGVGVIDGQLSEVGKQAVNDLVALGEQGWEILTKIIGDLLSAEIGIKFGLDAELALKDGAEPGKLRAGEFIDDPLSRVCLFVGMEGGIYAKSNFLGENSYDIELDFVDVPCTMKTTQGNGGDPKQVEEWFAEPIGSTIFVYGTASADNFRITQNTNGDILLFNGGAYQTFDFDVNDPDRIRTVHVDLRGERTPVDDRVDDKIRSKDGGNDSVTVASVFFDEVEVVVYGGSGNDVITAYDSKNDNFYDGKISFVGGGGNDTLTGGNGPTNLLLGDHESDPNIFGDDTLNAGPGAAILMGQHGDDLLRGLQPNLDTNNGSGGTMAGGLGFDRLEVGSLSDGDWLLVGGELVLPNSQPSGKDAGGFILGGPKDDTIIGGHAMFDTSLSSYVPIHGTGNHSWLSGGPGDDFVFGTPGNDYVIGGELGGQTNSGVDFLSGFSGIDLLSPANITTTVAVGIWAPYEVSFDENADQNEVILGGDNEDLLLIGPGQTNLGLYGGAGNDIFLFSDNFVSPNGKVDEIGGNILIDGGGGNENRIAFNDLGGAAKNVVISASQIIGLSDGTIDYQGVFDNPSFHDGIIINASERNDQFLVSSVDIGDTLQIIANGGDDSFSVASTMADDNGTLDDIQGRLSIIGGEDNDRIYINDRGGNGSAVEFHYLVEPNSVTDLPNPEASERTFKGVFFDGTTESLRLDGTDAANTFDVSPSPDTGFFIDGNLPEPQHVCAQNGDFLRLNTDGTTGRKLTITDVGEGFWAFDQPHQPVFFESIERFNHVEIIAIAEPAGNGSQPRVRVFDAETNEFKFEFLAYEADYENGISVAVGDVNEDGLPDIVTAPGRLRAPEVRVFSGAPMPGVQGTQIAELTIPASDTYGDNYVWGAHVAVGDVLGNGCNAIITAPGRNIETVKIYAHDPADPTANIGQRPFAEMASFEPFADVPEMIGGAYVAVADFDGDDDNNHRGDIVVGSGSGIPSQVRVFESSAELAFTQIRQIDDSDQETLFGLKVATGDIDGDETPDIVTSGLSRGSSVVNVYDGTPGSANTPVQTLTAFTDLSMIAPVDIAIADFDENGMDDIFAHQGPDGRNNSQVRIFDHTSNQIGSYDPISASQPSVALQLDRDHGFTFTGDYRTNQNGLNEKWISSESGESYYITPDGNLYRLHSGLVSNATLIATLHPCVYIEPALLHLAFDTYAASNADAEDRLPVSLSIDKIGIRQGNNFYLDANGNGTWNRVLAGDTFRDFGISSIATTATPVTGDWDGDGMDDLGLYNNGRFYLDTNGNGVWNKVVGGDTFRDFGISSIAATAIPVTGDWDGDGDDDLGLFNDGKFYLDTNDNGAWDKVAGGDTFTNFGISSIASTATPVTGDWNGDGDDDLGLFKDGRFYLDTSGNFKWDQVSGGDTFRNFGIPTIAATAKPITGNWDGDSDDDLGLFNDGRFYLDTNSNGVWDKVSGGDTYHNFGIELAGGAVSPLAGRWQRPSSLMAAARSNGQESLAIPASPAVDLLRVDQLQPIIDAALVRIAASGVSGAELNTLSSVTFAIADLPGAQLGSTSGSRVTLDAAAAGYGWFIDPTPQDDSEFQSDSELSTTESRLRMDLLTVVMHELQHVLGHGHTNGSNDLLNPELPTGRRRLPADDLDTLMGESDLLSEVLSLPDAQESFREV